MSGACQEAVIPCLAAQGPHMGISYPVGSSENTHRPRASERQLLGAPGPHPGSCLSLVVLELPQMPGGPVLCSWSSEESSRPDLLARRRRCPAHPECPPACAEASPPPGRGAKRRCGLLWPHPFFLSVERARLVQIRTASALGSAPAAQGLALTSPLFVRLVTQLP